LVKQSEHNLNWFEITEFTGINDVQQNAGLIIFPNPADQSVTIELNSLVKEKFKVLVYNLEGSLMCKTGPSEIKVNLSTSALSNGVYYLVALSDNYSPYCSKLVINRR
jgi:hypothetical protein